MRPGLSYFSASLSKRLGVCHLVGLLGRLHRRVFLSLRMKVGFGIERLLQLLPQQIPVPLEKLRPVGTAVKPDRAKLGGHSLVDSFVDEQVVVHLARFEQAFLRIVDLLIDLRALERLDLAGETAAIWPCSLLESQYLLLAGAPFRV